MIADFIVVLKKGKDPDPKEIILDPDPRGPKCYGSFGSGSGTLHETGMRYFYQHGTLLQK
jgi:hypothetical protein